MIHSARTIRHLPTTLVILLAAAGLFGCTDGEPAQPEDAGPDAAPRMARDMRVDPPPDMQSPPDAAPDGRVEVDAAADLGPARPACDNGIDDDDDGAIDLTDPGCVDPTDDDEGDPADVPECANGIDDDDDGLEDYPADPDCVAAGGLSEGEICGPGRPVVPLEVGGLTTVLLPSGEPIADATCGQGIGPAGVAHVQVEGPARVSLTIEPPGAVRLFVRSRCRDRGSEVACVVGVEGEPAEFVVDGTRDYYVFVQPIDGPLPREVQIATEIVPVDDTCRNGEDDDGDGLVDQADPGCSDAADTDETDPAQAPACANGQDDDGDGAVDWPDDRECRGAGGISEGTSCSANRVVELGAGRHEVEFEFDSAVEGQTGGACGGNGDEAVVLLEVARPSRLSAIIETPEIGTIATYLRQRCDVPATETLCDAAFSRRELVVERLEIGTYALFFDHDVGFAERQDRVTAEIELEPLRLRACENSIDDDEDGLIDAADPGCARAGDDDEVDPAAAPACANAVDDDADEAVDWPADASCPMAGSAGEGVSCVGDGPFIPVGDAGGTFAIDARPFAPGRAIARCGGDLGAESVFVLDLEFPANVTVSVAGAPGAYRIFGRGDCALADTESGCSESGQLRFDALPVGRVYVFVEIGPVGSADVTFTVDSLVRQCNDRQDNDEDGLTDLADPGCENGFDRSEVDPDGVPACFDGIDNDEDGAIDWPDDPQCQGAGDPDEALVCLEPIELIELDAQGGKVAVLGLGDPVGRVCGGFGRGQETAIAVTVNERARITAVSNRGMTLGARRDCADAETEFACGDGQITVDVEAGTTYILASPGFGEGEVEIDVQSLVRKCNDEIDNDGDDLIDLEDPGCTNPLDDDERDPDEVPQCADGIDNDGDGAIDWPDDPECTAAGVFDEELSCRPIANLIRIPPEGGVFDTDTRDVENNFQAQCAGGARGGEEVLVMNIDDPSDVVIEIIEGDYDTALFIRDRCDDQGREIACDDDGGEGTLSRIARRFDPGVYFIFVDGFGERRGAARVRVSFGED